MRTLLADEGYAPPAQLSGDGLVLVANGRPRVGVWIMPDNAMHGMIETFLARLVPPEDPVLEEAARALERARAVGASFREVHRDRAHIHTWLAWQDKPGARLHEALKFGLLTADSPAGVAFIAWFRRLFDL